MTCRRVIGYASSRPVPLALPARTETVAGKEHLLKRFAVIVVVLAALATPLVVDLRNIYRPEELTRRGFTYVSVGRPAEHPHDDGKA